MHGVSKNGPEFDFSWEEGNSMGEVGALRKLKGDKFNFNVLPVFSCFSPLVAGDFFSNFFTKLVERCIACRVGHRVLLRSERSVLSRSKRERYVLFHSFLEFLATNETQKNVMFRSFPFFSRDFGDL